MIEILHYEKANKNKAIGYLDIKITIQKPTTFILRKIAHLESGSKKWFSFPSLQREKNGEASYPKYYQFETDIYNSKLLEALHEKVKEYCEKNNLSGDQDIVFAVDNGDIPF
jgi:hypothetical protein